MRSGHGRAVHLVGPEDRELVLAACAETWAYDRQCEAPRTAYLLELAERAGMREEVRRQTLRALPRDKGSFDVDQLVLLAEVFAHEGDGEATARIAEQLRRTPERYSAAGAMVRLSPAEGLRAVESVIAEDWIARAVTRTRRSCWERSRRRPCSRGCRGCGNWRWEVQSAVARTSLNPLDSPTGRRRPCGRIAAWSGLGPVPRRLRAKRTLADRPRRARWRPGSGPSRSILPMRGSPRRRWLRCSSSAAPIASAAGWPGIGNLERYGPPVANALGAVRISGLEFQPGESPCTPRSASPGRSTGR